MAENRLLSQQRAGIPRARARFLTQSMELEEQSVPTVASAGVLLSMLLLLGCVLWARVTPVSEVAHTEGEIIPAGRVHQVQHLEGGIVQHIHVDNGDLVQANDVLLELRTKTASSEMAQVRSRKRALEHRLARLETLLAAATKTSTAERKAAASRIAALPPIQRQLLTEQRHSHAEQIALLDAQAHQREREIVAKNEQLRALQEEVDLMRERAEIHGSAKSSLAISRVDLIDAKARLVRAIVQLRSVNTEIEVAKEGVAEARQKKREFISRWREERQAEAESAQNELQEVNEELTRFGDRLDRMQIRAPVAGVVKAMEVNTINAVLQPGQVIMEIVPVTDALVVEAKILPRDVGHVHPGQRVDVKVSSFEPQRFGTIGGSLRKVSASTYFDQEQQPYYKAEILLSKSYFGADPNANRLIPGMTVQADIRTGEKTVLDYILKPVYRGFSGAMQER